MLKLIQDPGILANHIDPEFMVSAHNYLPYDADFGVTESKERKNELFLVATAKTNSFEVIELEREEGLCSRKIITDKGKIVCI